MKTISRKHARWTEAEIQYLRDNSKKMPITEMADALGRTVAAVQSVLRDKKISRRKVKAAPQASRPATGAAPAPTFHGHYQVTRDIRIPMMKKPNFIQRVAVKALLGWQFVA